MNDKGTNQWKVEYNSGIPVYRQIINHACAALADGSLKAGDQLPTIRALSGHLNVNPNTVAKAYRELELKGIILSERGSGSFIQPQTPASAPEATVAEKRAKLEELYHRLLGDAGTSGVTESELLNFIKERDPSTL
ncbi:MAG TPA: GntR family transcriptional regulator [Verrucomicrobiae bacterium]|jgi:GntR family transcriptional regulator|nr:GntR family transcriptional regulator [Verrucomicrobiae bacterium]